MDEKLADQVTFRERSYVVVDPDTVGVCTTPLGNLAIFSTQGVAERWVESSSRDLQVVPVRISLDLD